MSALTNTNESKTEVSVVWDVQMITVITRIQREELKLAWYHDKMYEILAARSYKWGWGIAIMGFLISIIAFIMVAINNSVFEMIGSIINGIIGLFIGFLTRQSERLNLETDAENHRRTACMHTALYEEIEYMKMHPSQDGDKYLFHVRSTSRSIRENAANLYILDEVKAQFIAECQTRGIANSDTFSQLGELVVIREPNRNSYDDLTDNPPKDPVPKKDKRKGYDAKKLEYELGRLST